MPLIPNFFSDIENEAKEKGKNALIKEWGISNTRLEEVFLRLVAQNKNLNADTNANADELNFEENIIIKRTDGKDTVRTTTVAGGLQKDLNLLICTVDWCTSENLGTDVQTIGRRQRRKGRHTRG